MGEGNVTCGLKKKNLYLGNSKIPSDITQLHTENLNSSKVAMV